MLVGAAFTYAVGVRRIWQSGREPSLVGPGQAAAFAGAIAVLLVALASPLDGEVGANLALHMVQHVLLLAVVPPLLAESAPVTVMLHALPSSVRRRLLPVSRRVARSQNTDAGWLAWTAGAFALATLTLAAWHIPALYDAAVTDDSLHALEHVTFVASATLFWWMVLHGGRRSRRGFGVIAVFVFTLPSTALGVLMTLAETSWYAPYGHGASAVRDQQVAGAVMWGVGGVAVVVSAAALFAAWLTALERADEQQRIRSAVEP
ncbi:MAG: putative rane protein [Actinomycetota bacterium]|nr:putative rane protein [Actinomycetota bacterium]